MKLPLLPCALLLLLATAPGPGPWPAAGMLPSVPCLSVCLLQSGPQQMLLRAGPLTICRAICACTGGSGKKLEVQGPPSGDGDLGGAHHKSAGSRQLSGREVIRQLVGSEELLACAPSPSAGCASHEGAP